MHLILVSLEVTGSYYTIMTTICTLLTHWVFLLQTIEQFMEDSSSTINMCKNANFPLQQRNSELCGVFCIYIAHVIYTEGFKLYLYINDNDLLRFATHLL